MVLVFILIGIIAFLAIITFTIVASTLKIEIKDFKLTNMSKINKSNYTIKISLNIFNIKWLWFSLSDEKVKKMISKIPAIDIKKLETDFKLEDIRFLGKLHTNISKLNLYAILGLKSPITTAFLIAFLSSVIGITLPHLVKKWKKENYYYSIEPIYNNQNLYKIKLDCIIELKIVHIINVIYILIKKGKSDKNERTASNRKSYAYSNE